MKFVYLLYSVTETGRILLAVFDNEHKAEVAQRNYHTRIADSDSGRLTRYIRCDVVAEEVF